MLINRFFRLTKNKSFTKSLRNFAYGVNSNKSLSSPNKPTSISQLFNAENNEIISARKDLYLSLDIKGAKNYDYNKIYGQLMKLISLSKPSEFLDEFTSVFLEKHIGMFSVEQMITLFTTMGKNNIGTIVSYNAFQHHLGKKLNSMKNIYHNINSEDNFKHSQLFLTYFSIISELSMMEADTLNFILEFFANHSPVLINEHHDTSSFKNLCSFMWFTSISLASILEKRRTLEQNESYVNTEQKVLTDKGARALFKILNHIDKLLSKETFKNYTEDTNAKVRLFKSLYYLQLDGVDLPKNLEKFLNDFLPFLKMNTETSITNSQLENTFEKILTTLNLPYEKEKKLSFCSVDFFINPHICIEVNGPQHYVFNSSLLVARDLLKQRTLALENYDMIPISYKDVLDSKQLLVFLNQRLKHVTSALFEDAAKEVSQLKDPEYLKQKDLEYSAQKLNKRIKNGQYLI